MKRYYLTSSLLNTKKLVCFLALVVISMATILLSQPVGAAEVDKSKDAVGGGVNDDFYSSNDITFYSAQACPVGGTASIGIGTLVGNTNAEQIWNYLIAKGLTAEQAAGVMGNIQQESGYKPGVEEQSGGGGFGIIQWTGGRRTNLEAAAADKGVPASDMLFQLDYMYEESINRTSKTIQGSNEWEGLKRQLTIEDALVYWHDNAERSADSPEKVISVRGANAQDAYNSFKNLAPISAPADVSRLAARRDCDPALSTATMGSAGIAKTTLAYAWPTYKGNTIDAMPDYTAAVTKAKSEGRYVGGTIYSGIDCGGFVTLLLHDSGFDPTYNYNGKSSDGAGPTDTQEAWAKANWQTLGRGNEINTADLKPGDVALQPGHTFIYVGDIPGFDSKVASASHNERAPMAGTESLTYSNATWYRKK